MFTLILVLAIDKGATTVVTDFGSFEACERARIHIVNNVKANKYYAEVVSQGCFKK